MKRSGTRCNVVVTSLVMCGAVASASLSLPFANAAPTLFAAGIHPGGASPVQREQAQSKFLKGRELFNQKKYPEAIVELRASMEIVQSPNARLYVARALREQGKVLEAYVEFGRTAVEADELTAQDARYAKTAASANLERKELAPKLGFVTVSVDHPEESTVLVVGGEEVKRAGWSEPIPVAPGSTDLELRTTGRVPLKQTVTLTAGQKSEAHFDAASAAVTAGATDGPAPPPSASADTKSSSTSGLRTGALIAGGVGVAGFLLGGIFGLAARSNFNDLYAACKPNCPPSRQSDIDAGKRDQVLANVGLTIGLVGVATGVTLFVLYRRGTATTQVGVSPTGLVLSGAF